MPRVPRLHRDSLDLQGSILSAAPGAPPCDPSPAPVPTSGTLVPNTQAPSISSEISQPTVEEGGVEKDMDLDDDAAMISRAPLSD